VNSFWNTDHAEDLSDDTDVNLELAGWLQYRLMRQFAVPQ
jgi:hypothetical protein